MTRAVPSAADEREGVMVWSCHATAASSSVPGKCPTRWTFGAVARLWRFRLDRAEVGAVARLWKLLTREHFSLSLRFEGWLVEYSR
jgi:hypothetical protein